MQQPDLNRLRHMLDAAKEAIKFTVNKSRKDLDRDRMLTLAIIKSIEIIGEAASKVSESCRSNYLVIPWIDIINIFTSFKSIHTMSDLPRENCTAPAIPISPLQPYSAKLDAVCEGGSADNFSLHLLSALLAQWNTAPRTSSGGFHRGARAMHASFQLCAARTCFPASQPKSLLLCNLFFPLSFQLSALSSRKARYLAPKALLDH
jgi:hypothetical protein